MDDSSQKDRKDLRQSGTKALPTIKIRNVSGIGLAIGKSPLAMRLHAPGSVDNQNGCDMVFSNMASITLKDLPQDLHGQLKIEAEANFRSLAQEALFRLQRSFEIDSVLKRTAHQRLIDEAIASGPEEPLTRAQLEGIKRTILRSKKA